ncbi:MAG: hypothetical protein WC785_09985 [Tatlockia sp.]|jgi:hypothetical protein
MYAFFKESMEIKNKSFNEKLFRFRLLLQDDLSDFDTDSFHKLLNDYNDIVEEYPLDFSEYVSDRELNFLLDLLSPHKIPALNLSGNKITIEGMKILIEWLKYQNVEELILNSNPIGDNGLAELLTALSDNKQLKFLELACSFTDNGIIPLANFLKIDASLQGLSIRVSHNVSELKILHDALNENKTLTYLRLVEPFSWPRGKNGKYSKTWDEYQKLKEDINNLLDRNRQGLGVSQSLMP